ncbi:MAG: hypothetical protein OEX98_00390 [Nitrosopumilus sp.]|nr:hypothetical protein [Nitrosopumilus sp.]
MQTWKRKLRIGELANITIKKTKSRTEISTIYKILDEIIVPNWKSIPATRK